VTDRSISVLCGGVGAARFLRGLIDVVDAASVTAIVNTGDDTELHGLSISPDIDTIVYTLAGAIDRERGWGLVDESWRAMEALERYESVRPEESGAAPRWFNLGDRDLATHFYRTARLAEGGSLTEVTDEIRRAWHVAIRVLPMSDDRVATVVTTAGGDLGFQDYFVRLRHDVPVTSIRFEGEGSIAPASQTALRDADVLVVAPSNPLVSIGPIRSLGGVDDTLVSRRDRNVAVSPIVGGVALKGPADRMLVELGHEPSVVGIARIYAPIASTLVVDSADATLVDQVEAEGMRCIVTESVMSTPEIAASLARVTIDAIT
jgi:LPPG:FO 2-phospho-L-lactate transferase